MQLWMQVVFWLMGLLYWHPVFLAVLDLQLRHREQLIM